LIQEGCSRNDGYSPYLHERPSHCPLKAS
jgi:hypothetical protein